MTAILFPSRMFETHTVDDAFADEERAARAAGFETALVHQQRLDDGEFARAVRAIAHEGLAVYRGWMLSAERYAELHRALEDRNVALINTAEQYVHCHHLPESFDVIASSTPAAVWVPRAVNGVDIEQVVIAARRFGSAPVIVKDHVKSRKHEWEEACFVPSAAVVSTFLERQGDSLEGGVVLREYVDLESVGTHPKSGMPLAREHRVFVLDGEPVVVGRYWSAGEYRAEDVPLADFAETMEAVRSRFFTMDLALGRDRGWRIIELGDAQVAGLLDTISPELFFQRLRERLSPESGHGHGTDKST